MFPVQYPNNAAPSFQFINPTSITASMKAKLLKVCAVFINTQVLAS